jgi:hypothetical protein
MFRWPGQNLPKDSLNTSSYILKFVYLDVVTVPFFWVPLFSERPKCSEKLLLRLGDNHH